MEYSLIIILLALLQYIVFTFRVGLARGKYSVPAPKCTGNETWERLFRVQQNTLEQLIIFIPAILMFSHYMSAKWAIAPGIGFLLARQFYSYMYLKNPPKRGFPVTMLMNVVLVVGSFIGIVQSLLKTT